MLNVYEQFKSIQGESTFAGLPCSFIRLSGCNLRCSYCDTSYAMKPGDSRSIDDVISTVEEHGCRLVEVTGGEPLLQDETLQLCSRLIDKGHTVLVETNGSMNIGNLPKGCVRIVDVKCPLSGAANSFYEKNLDLLGARDEVKFVISGRTDFDWALSFCHSRKLIGRCEIIFSPAQGFIAPQDLAEWIVASNIAVRLGLQLHWYIWGPNSKGH
jgi:7-carboxy-7-deazaguanine synthase